MEKALCFALFLMLLPSVNANEVDELKRLVISLNSHVLNLEKRVKKLENPVKLQNNNIYNSKVVWRKLKKGMSHSQVRNLLGEPKNIDNSSSFVKWYYTNSLYHSYVEFYSDKARSWKESTN
ncbi:MAG: outer membrane protein assembly factor BamE (lipoprotein component of BamABCDE complex) [Colwellia sp.]|jgi:outer membrane protein assembly factor BamE (lipoprotein component of BamABCDE complex)